MHFLIAIAILTGFVMFAFGEDIARGFMQGLFILAALAFVLLLWDVYREIPEKRPARYKVMEWEYMPKRQQASPTAGWTFR